MAFFEMHYHSDALRMGVSVNVIIPESAKTLIGMQTSDQERYKTLFLLHGLSDDHSIWMRRTSIVRYAAEHGIAVVMPSVNRCWYTDTAYGANYFTFISQELPKVCRGFFKGMSDKREDTLIAGLSMGGYGAMKVALKCPETFGGCASLSGAFDIFAPRRLAGLAEWQGIFGFDLQDPSQLQGSEQDVYALVSKNAEAGIEFPKLYLWCGESDTLAECNRQMDALLTEHQIPHLYAESEGNHSWKWWDLHIQDALSYLLK